MAVVVDLLLAIALDRVLCSPPPPVFAASLTLHVNQGRHRIFSTTSIWTRAAVAHDLALNFSP